MIKPKYICKYSVTNDLMNASYALKPSAAVMYFQDAFARYMTSKNIAAFDISDRGLYWVVSEFNINFEKDLPFWTQEVETTIWLSEITKLKNYFDFELKCENKIFAKGNSCWFLLNENKRPVSTDIVAKRTEVYSESGTDEHKKFMVPETTEKLTEKKHKVCISDIDFNNHVNNKSYINLARTTLSDEYKQTHSLKRLSAKFNKEAFLDDELICSAYSTDEPNTFVHKIEREGISVCNVISQWRNETSTKTINDCNLPARKINKI